jgi:hypothetical protein
MLTLQEWEVVAAVAGVEEHVGLLEAGTLLERLQQHLVHVRLLRPVEVLRHALDAGELDLDELADGVHVHGGAADAAGLPCGVRVHPVADLALPGVFRRCLPHPVSHAVAHYLKTEQNQNRTKPSMICKSDHEEALGS